MTGQGALLSLYDYVELYVVSLVGIYRVEIYFTIVLVGQFFQVVETVTMAMSVSGFGGISR